ncbi:MAG: hypothetical protein JRD89_01905 [Deltaproteobacteria bacterium]|nr:hypothetical protein [Deltaproteobacteria bacterium]
MGQRTEQITIETCDSCGKDIHCTSNICNGCGKLTCPNCTLKWDTSPWTETYYSTGYAQVCPQCNEIAKPLTKQSEQILEKAHQETSKIRDNWKHLCRETRKNKEERDSTPIAGYKSAALSNESEPPKEG